MATVVLQTVGAAIGGAVAGPLGALLGRAVGAAAGHAIDQSYLAKDKLIEGPRLDQTRLMGSIEGQAIPRVYGRCRISGQIIWATRFEETLNRSETSAGGKGGGSKVVQSTYSYDANFAIGLCEGPVSTIRRIWADGEELDLTQIDYRFYQGDENQMPDPLIEAKQGLGNAPAYRGLSYVVFDSFPLADYGNRIPQFSFEIIRSIGKLEQDIRSVSLIPGSTEFGYDPLPVSSGGGDEAYALRNGHGSVASTDWTASLDELQALCPNLERVSLVVSWFGTDLRAGECEILPGTTNRVYDQWQVGPYGRSGAHLISKVDGKPAFGGTPDDGSVRRAIADLKARGLEVWFYPFIMMDIPAGNTLPGVDGSGNQPAYPWRGEITCYPGPGSTGSADQTNTAASQLSHFASRYSAMIAHYADLCAEAGGVDGFLIGSEMRSLTRVRDGSGNFPFVGTLLSLAQMAKAKLGGACLVTYAADWSEYFGYQPGDGSGDVFYNLDSLWASDDIDAVGIDNYMPLADWREGRDPANPDVQSAHDLEYMISNVAGGEGYEWYYASQHDRQSGTRTPITDGYDEPWVFRYKDLYAWWSNLHHDRPSGVPNSQATLWQPQSKPIIFTELGCPAVDHGANQPNVFPDPKSDQSAIPYFSSGGRDDLMQRRFLEAHYAYWQAPENNPVSPLYGGKMLSVPHITPWAWDTRPFPWFPQKTDVWSDGDNWSAGHWLNGRIGGCSLQDLTATILQDFGLEPAEIKLDGIVDGYVIPEVNSVRAALEPLFALFHVSVSQSGGVVQFSQPQYANQILLEVDELVQEGDGKVWIEQRDSDIELPLEALLKHQSVFGEYEPTATLSRRLAGNVTRQISMQLPAVIPEPAAGVLVEEMMRSLWGSRTRLEVTLARKELSVRAGDLVRFEGANSDEEWLVEEVEFGLGQALSLRSCSKPGVIPGRDNLQNQQALSKLVYGKPLVLFMDLPALQDTDNDQTLLYAAAAAKPWARQYSVYSSTGDDGFESRATIEASSIIGRLIEPVSEGPVGLFDRANTLVVEVLEGSFESKTSLEVFGGKNTLAVECNNGGYEIIQFVEAQLDNEGHWRLGKLLRAQLGSEDEMVSGALVGGRVVLLDNLLTTVSLQADETGLAKNWRTGPASQPVGSNSYDQQTITPMARTKRMFSPVHLRCQRIDNEFRFSWIRRGRKNSDSWQSPEIPLDATVERYVMTFGESGGEIRQTVNVDTASFVYPLSSLAQDFGQVPEVFTVTVAQLNETGEAGGEAKIEVHTNP